MILVIEPQCTKFEHTDFNASFISILNNMYNDKKIIFWAEREHLEYLIQNNGLLKNKQILTEIIHISSRLLPENKRFISEFKLMLIIFKYAKKNNINKIFFTSITSAGLLALKIIKNFYPNIEIFIVLHGILDEISKKPSKSLKRKLFEFKNILFNLNNHKIKYVLLCDSIKKELLKINNSFKNKIITIDLPPYLYKENQPEINNKFNEVILNKKIDFATFGVAHKLKGSVAFFKLADKISNQYANFTLIGHITDPSLIKDLSNYKNIILPSIKIPLTPIEFEQLAYNIDYSIFMYPYDMYKLRASGAFFDSVFYEKPIIAIRNPFFEHYFNEFGNIGYLCDSNEELEALIEKIIKERPTEVYNQQRLAVVNMKKELSLEKLTNILKNQIN